MPETELMDVIKESNFDVKVFFVSQNIRSSLLRFLG